MLRSKPARFACLLIVLPVLYVAPVIAQTYTYNTGASGNWTANSTWQNGSLGKPPVSGNCDCVIYINPGHRLTINQNVNISNAKIILLGAGSELRFSSEVVLPQTMQLNGNASIEVRTSGANIESKSNFLGYNGNTISINGTVVFQGYSTMVNSTTRGVVNGPASASSSMSPPMFVNMVLPVKLVEFDANEYTGHVSLQWKTSQEENFDHFEIEKSLDGKQWLKIGTANGKNNGRITSLYSFTDYSPAAGINYYRLKMVDIDLQFVYSKIVAANSSLQYAPARIYPNPARSVLYVSNIRQGVKYSVDLINESGQVVVSQKSSSPGTTVSLNVASARPGTYFLKISYITGFIQIYKAVIAR